MDWKNRVYCGKLTADDADKNVLLYGWVDAIRTHTNVIFIHLRDISGIVQVVFNDKCSAEVHDLARTLKEEFLLEIRGTVSLRAKGTENPNIRTSTIEVIAQELIIISHAKKLPFKISEKAMFANEITRNNPDNIDEELRLRFRYLELRRPSYQERFMLRQRVLQKMREYMFNNNFIELDTPFLTKSTPEGARDYLVPSRIHKGAFYALPQSPQLFKQLFMIGGFDRYYQIVRCFRDEDLRANRQPEFTQLDIEASFVDEEFIFKHLEALTIQLFALNGITLPSPFQRMTYAEAMERYGSDKPDLRFGMDFKDVTDIMANTEYTIFKKIIGNKGFIKGFCIKGQAETLSKNVLQNEYAFQIAPSFGAKGMTWMKVVNGELESNIAQFFSEQEKMQLMEWMNAENGDVVIMIADSSMNLINSVLNNLRLHFANRLGIIPRDKFCPVWITEFPMFELKDGKLNALHHPFTMPAVTDFDPKDRDELLRMKSKGYDMVINGEEVGGGSVRIHDSKIQKKIFQALGLSSDEAKEKFGFFLEALKYGTPPHAGIALGLDRLVAMIMKLSSIREVIPFPKNKNALCPLTLAPTTVSETQLKELGLNLSAFARKARSEK
ncbi:aspartate--tRNA ligase [candidate division KSB1 bacterium]|nr:aspartate--tRNA ligase [candidate division KSB1 bacterium]